MKKMPDGLDRRQRAAWFMKNADGTVMQRIMYLRSRQSYTDDEITQALDDAADGGLVKEALKGVVD